MPPIEPSSKSTYKRGKRKVAAKQPSPQQCLDWLAASNLHGVLCRGAVWLACTKQLAYFLERVCLGRRAPSPDASAGVPVFFNRLGSAASGANDAANPVVVRLSPEETFYMAHIVDCLTVHSVEKGVPPGEESVETQTGDATPGDAENKTWLMRLTQHELWEKLVLAGADSCSDDSNFPARCAVHVHFRKQGWLPRSGLQYGADVVLYRNHPSLVHSDFCAVLRPSAETVTASRRAVRSFTSKQSGELKTDQKKHTTSTSGLGLRRWTEVQAMSRLCVQVNKGLVSCSVELSDLECDLSTPKCLLYMTVTETEIQRFNPTRNKES